MRIRGLTSAFLLILAVPAGFSWLGAPIVPVAFAQEPAVETITTAMPQAWPPHYIAGPGEKPTGFAVEILDAVAARAGYRVSYQVTRTMKEAFDMAASGEVDLMANIGIVPSRMNLFSFTDPVETFAVSIFVRTDSFDVAGAPDLAGRRVAVVKRNMGLRLMGERPDVQSVVFEDVRSALFDLVAGRVDALVYPAPVLLNLAREVGIDEHIKTVGEPLLEVKRAIAVHPSRVEIHRRLSVAVADFVGTQEYQDIYLRWFGRPAPYWTPERVLASAGAILLVIVIVFSSWHYRTIMRLNRALEDRVEKRTAELRDTQAELLLKERLAALGELTGTVAHEIRNPLGAVVTACAVIKEKVKAGNYDLDASVERAERNIDRCTGIIEDLLEYARVGSDKREDVPIDGLVREVLDEYPAPARITIELRPGLGDRTARVDPEHIRRILINFLDNACQAISEQGAERAGTIVVETRQTDGGIDIMVSDDGPGMADSVRERIFEPLFSTRSFGVGLGLSNAQKIVSEHGGHLAVDSAPGAGTSVRVSLPSTAAQTPAGQ